MIAKTVPDVAESLHVVVAGLRDLVNIFVEGEGDLSKVTLGSFTVSDRRTIKPATLMWDMLYKELLR